MILLKWIHEPTKRNRRALSGPDLLEVIAFRTCLLKCTMALRAVAMTVRVLDPNVQVAELLYGGDVQRPLRKSPLYRGRKSLIRTSQDISDRIASKYLK